MDCRKRATYGGWHGVGVRCTMVKVEDEHSDDDRQRTQDHYTREVHACMHTVSRTALGAISHIRIVVVALCLMPWFHVQLSHATRCNDCRLSNVSTLGTFWKACNYGSVLHAVIAHETTPLHRLMVPQRIQSTRLHALILTVSEALVQGRF